METHPHGATSLLPQLRVLSQLAQTPDAALLGGCCSRSVASAVSDSVRPHRRQPTELPRPGLLQAGHLGRLEESYSRSSSYPGHFATRGSKSRGPGSSGDTLLVEQWGFSQHPCPAWPALPVPRAASQLRGCLCPILPCDPPSTSSFPPRVFR